MNRRIIVSLIVIAVLALFLILGNRRKTVDVPEVKKWEGTADKILISKGENRMEIFKKKGKWVLNKEEFPADEKTVEKLQKAINEMEVIDLISKKPHYSRYDLQRRTAGIGNIDTWSSDIKSLQDR